MGFCFIRFCIFIVVGWDLHTTNVSLSGEASRLSNRCSTSFDTNGTDVASCFSALHVELRQSVMRVIKLVMIDLMVLHDGLCYMGS